MYFVVSKIGWLLVQPSTMLLWGTFIGLVLSKTKFANFGRLLAWISGSVLAVCALTPLGVVLMHPLENHFAAPSFNEISVPNGIITLGGALDVSLTRARGPIALNCSGARLTEALALAYRFPKARLIFSGGSADLLGNGVAEGDVAKEFFSELGLSMDRLTIERKSRNTSENAQFTRDLVEPEPGQRWVLVTSAFHMPRAVASFQNAGFQVTPYPVAYFTFGDASDYWAYMFSPLSALSLINVAVKEWVGLAVYWVSGKTISFLPAMEHSVLQG